MNRGVDERVGCGAHIWSPVLSLAKDLRYGEQMVKPTRIRVGFLCLKGYEALITHAIFRASN